MTRTFTAVTPHAKVKSRNVIAADVIVVRLHAQEDVFLHAVDVVRALADHLGQWRSLDLHELLWREHPRIFIEKSAMPMGSNVKEHL